MHISRANDVQFELLGKTLWSTFIEIVYFLLLISLCSTTYILVQDTF